jgi:hypothetical protein
MIEGWKRTCKCGVSFAFGNEQMMDILESQAAMAMTCSFCGQPFIDKKILLTSVNYHEINKPKKLEEVFGEKKAKAIEDAIKEVFGEVKHHHIKPTIEQSKHFLGYIDMDESVANDLLWKFETALDLYCYLRNQN